MATIAGPVIQLPTTVGPTVTEQGNLRIDWIAFLSTMQQVLYADTRSGPTASRPTSAMPGRYIGMSYFDTTLGHPIWLMSVNPDVWLDCCTGGVPTGGTSGQVLAKASGTDYDTEWTDASGGGGGGGGGGMTQISSGTISAPVSYLDIELPTGYVGYKLVLINPKGSIDDDALCFALSSDGGATWYNDLIDYDTYTQLVTHYDWNGSGAPSSSLGYGPDAVAAFTGYKMTPQSSGTIDCSIQPGAIDTRASVKFDFTNYARSPTLSDNLWIIGNGSLWLDEYVGRVNKMRILPYGNGDVAPPTSGETLTAGSYILYGHAV